MWSRNRSEGFVDRVTDYFAGRNLQVATMHGKETVLGPLLADALGVVVHRVHGFDTDAFGTFTGEVERLGDALAAARAKCHRALDLTGGDLAVASEGSFGPHPVAGFLPSHEELVVLVDRKQSLEITAREFTTTTNYASATVTSPEELRSFAANAQFPAHSLILRPERDAADGIVKGLSSWEALHAAFEELQRGSREVWVETDMRAMHNPTRMDVLRKATLRLIEKVSIACPTCETPGFDAVGIERGLPCSTCSHPTRSVLSYTYVCQRCSFTLDVRHPHGKTAEDPRHCDRCNP